MLIFIFFGAARFHTALFASEPETRSTPGGGGGRTNLSSIQSNQTRREYTLSLMVSLAGKT